MFSLSVNLHAFSFWRDSTLVFVALEDVDEIRVAYESNNRRP